LPGIANGIFFNLGARLARYTGNDTYAKYANETWDWIEKIGFLNNETYAVYDGAHVEDNCTDINKQEFSYNNAVFTLGAAHMYNYTDGSELWKNRVQKLVDHGLSYFFPDNIAVEPSCETARTCTTDMQSFKGFVHRWYATATTIAPFIADQVLPVLSDSANAAIKTCTAGSNGRQCGFVWTNATNDGLLGAGEQMDVLGATSALLVSAVHAPLTAKTGGTSKGNPTAGQSSDNGTPEFSPITTGDRAGAGILTAVVLGCGIGLFVWMSTGD
jgi:mannan endo-1,6-alpha-mannosidase